MTKLDKIFASYITYRGQILLLYKDLLKKKKKKSQYFKEKNRQMIWKTVHGKRTSNGP